MFAVEQSPSIVLGISQFDVLCTHLLRHRQNLLDMVKVLPMQYDVEHHGIALLLDQPGDLALKLEGSGVAQEIIQFTGRILQAELNMIEACTAEVCNAPFVESDA